MLHHVTVSAYARSALKSSHTLQTAIAVADTRYHSAGLWQLISRLLGWSNDEKDPEKCQRYISRIPSEMGNINIYEIYVCSPSSARLFRIVHSFSALLVGFAPVPWPWTRISERLRAINVNRPVRQTRHEILSVPID